jgi:hypothetical protein
MQNITGSMTLNGITDPELVKILEIKIKHEKFFSFSPQAMQPQSTGGQNPEQFYNNVQFGWNNRTGLEAVNEVVSFLVRKEEKKVATG